MVPKMKKTMHNWDQTYSEVVFENCNWRFHEKFPTVTKIETLEIFSWNRKFIYIEMRFHKNFSLIVP